jgi:hypothetical protein
VFIRGTNTKQLEVPKIAGRNTKANIFQKGNAEHKATIDLKKKINKKIKKNCIKVVSPFT